MRQKIASFVVAAAFAATAIAPAGALAQTTATTSVSALIQQLQQQIADLQSKITALKQAQSQVVQSSQNVTQTLRSLKQLCAGMSGDDVKTLQALLAADPQIFPEGRITGFFGPLTANAVRRFQKKHGFEQVGCVGPKTLKKLNELLEEQPLALEKDDEDEDEDEDREEKLPCAIVPPGHLIAPGWLRKMGGVRPIVPECQKLPPGIEKKLEGQGHATTTVDTATPLIRDIAVSNVGSTTVTVGWHTNEPATSKAYYGTVTPLVLGSASMVQNVSLVMNHSLNLSGLTASTTYFYVVESKDAANNTATSSEHSFITTQ